MLWKSALILFGALLTLITGCKIALAIAQDLELSHVSGAWIAIAQDFSEGVLYRPLYSDELGTGGTRYMPLFAVLLGWLIQVTGMPLASGYLLSVASSLLLLVCVFALLRILGLSTSLAFVLSALLSAARCIQLGFEGIRGDTLPLVFTILGLVIYLRQARYGAISAAILFSLAFATKLTAVSGPAALFCWLLFQKRPQAALQVALLTAAGYAAVLAILYLSTSGYFFEIFRMCSVESGADWLARAPVRFTVKLMNRDVVCAHLFFIAVIAGVFQFNKVAMTLPASFLLITLLSQLVIFADPGIDLNHLVDLAVAAVLLIGTAIRPLNLAQMRSTTIVYIIIASIFSLYTSLKVKEGIEKKPGPWAYPAELVDIIRDESGIIISENPVLPIKAGRRPFVLDPYMLRVVMSKDPDIRDAICRRLEQQEFAALIFMYDPDVDVDWYEQTHFGPQFMQTAFANYQEAYRVAHYVVYLPHPR